MGGKFFEKDITKTKCHKKLTKNKNPAPNPHQTSIVS